MIKKIFMLIVILSVCSCSVQRINEVLFIASIGLEKDNNGYIGYFYLPSSEDIGKANEGGSGSGEFAKFEGKSLSEVFEKSQSSTELSMNLRHSSSIVLNKELLSDDFLEELIGFIKYSPYLDMNFYIFITEDKLEDIYGFKNPNKESVLNSILVATYDSPSIYLSADPIHFLEFARNFYEEKCIRFPLLKANKIWKINSEDVKSYYCSDMLIYNRGKIEVVEEDKRVYYMKKNSHFYDEINENPLYFQDYIFKIKYREKIIISIRCKYTSLSNIKIECSEVKKLIEERINSFLEEYQKIDFLNLEYFNYIYSKNLNYHDVEIKADVRTF